MVALVGVLNRRSSVARDSWREVCEADEADHDEVLVSISPILLQECSSGSQAPGEIDF